MKVFWPSFISNLLGFSFALVLFFVSQWLRRKSRKTNSLKYLKREFEFNIGLLKSYIANFEDKIQILRGHKDGVFASFDFSKVQTNFFSKCLNDGYLYDKFNNEEISELSNILSYFSADTEKYLNSFLSNYGKESAITFYPAQKKDFESKKNYLVYLKDKL